jgi:phytoene desaturase
MLAPLCLLLSSFTGCASLDVRNAPPPSSATALKQQKHIAVIGAGFSGLTAACELAQLGYDVTLFDKHAEVGGRARTFTTESGFTFDYGPSWYWMPGIFDHVFARYGKKVKEYYNLTLLDPAYRVELPTGVVDVPGTYEGILDLAKERGGEDADLALRLFFDEAEEKFEQGVYDFIWKPMVSFTELIDTALMRAGLELDMFSGFASHLSRFTKDPLIHMLLKWPVIFIGASPDDAASMYSLMTYAGHVRGTWYVRDFYFSIYCMTEYLANIMILYHDYYRHAGTPMEASVHRPRRWPRSPKRWV